MQLTVEQELAVRQEIARRIGRLRNDTLVEGSSAYVDGYNEALRDAVVEIMGGDPIHIRERTMIDGPGGGSDGEKKTEHVMKGKYVEDVHLHEPGTFPPGWDLP